MVFFLVSFFSLFFIHSAFAQKIESSFESRQSGSGSQEINAHGKTDHGNYQIEYNQHHDMDTAGSTFDSQKVTYTGPDGKQYTETHTWKYDAFTEETRETHRIEGEAPKEIPEPAEFNPENGVKVDGEANGEPVESKYGSGGLEDHWPQPGDERVHWVDLNKNHSGDLDFSNKTGYEIESAPARTIPLICQIAGLAWDPFAWGVAPLSLNEQMLQNPQKISEAFEEMMKKLKMNLPRDKEKAAIEELIDIVKVEWKYPFRFWGYPAEHYAVLVGKGKAKRKRADIWVIPKINIWNVLKGKNRNREKNIEDMMLPHWEGVSLAKQKKIFSKLAVMFFDNAFGKYYIAQSMEKLPHYIFHRPPTPEGFQIERMTQKQIIEMGKAAEQTFWQGWNP